MLSSLVLLAYYSLEHCFLLETFRTIKQLQHVFPVLTHNLVLLGILFIQPAFLVR